MKKEKNIGHIRREYLAHALDESSVNKDPFAQFSVWFEEAEKIEGEDVNCMTLATATGSGKPSARTVLLKEFGKSGFTFFTNYESRKGQELNENPNACLLIHWCKLERQVRIEGHVEKTTYKTSSQYFDSRPLESRLSAIASPQSRTISNRKLLEDKVAALEKEYTTQPPPCPQAWGGYIVVPEYIEFWQGRANRLHDRIVYTKTERGIWGISRLAP